MFVFLVRLYMSTKNQKGVLYHEYGERRMSTFHRSQQKNLVERCGALNCQKVCDFAKEWVLFPCESQCFKVVFDI